MGMSLCKYVTGLQVHSRDNALEWATVVREGLVQGAFATAWLPHHRSAESVPMQELSLATALTYCLAEHHTRQLKG